MAFRKSILTLVLPLCLSLMIGCATIPGKKSFDKSLNKQIQTIALIAIDEPSEYTIFTNANPPGLIGGLGAVATMKERSKIFKEAADKYIPPLGAHLQELLEKQLRSSGYDIKKVSGLREKKDDLISDYSKIKADSDAILDVVLLVGYQSTILSPFAKEKFEPFVRLKAKMVLGKDGESVYSEYITYGHRNPFARDSWGYIPATKNLVYKDFESILADKKQAAEALLEGTELVAEYLARTLSK